MRLGSVEEEDRPGRFTGVKHPRRAAAFELAARAAGDLGHGTVAAHFDAVVGALQAVAQHRALGQRRATVRAVVFEGMHAAIVVAPQGDLVAQAAHRHRLLAKQLRGQHRKPEVFEAVGQVVLNRIDGELHIHLVLPPAGHAPSRAIRVL
ncbi:hypothetical protein D3C85_1253310 [compost metagenome]